MASIDKRIRNGATTYRVRYRDPDGRQRMKSLPRMADARRYKTEVETGLNRGTYVDPRGTTTVAEYAYAWIAARPHRPTTAKRVRSFVDNHIAGTRLGSRRLVDVRSTEVRAWASERAKLLAPTTTRVLITLLRSIFASAVDDRLVGVSPVTRIKLPRAERSRDDTVTVEQVFALAATSPPRCRAMILTQAGLGLRLGELLGLRVTDVDFLRRTVRIECQITSGATKRSEPKTTKSRRTIELPTFVADALAAHLQQYPPGADGTLFTTSAGTPYRQQSYGRMFEMARRRAGMPEGITSHDLRHHYISVLVGAGVDPMTVAKWVGHEDATLIWKVYGHMMPGSTERARKTLDAVWASVPAMGPAVAGEPG